MSVRGVINILKEKFESELELNPGPLVFRLFTHLFIINTRCIFDAINNSNALK